MMRRLLLLLTVAAMMAAMMVVSAYPAFAQGQVEQGPEHANSICSFSGLNDEPEAAGPEGGRVQSYGQLVRQDVIEPSTIQQPEPELEEPSPGNFCNPNNFSLK